MKVLKALFYTVLTIILMFISVLAYIIFPNETGFVFLGVLITIVILGIFQTFYNRL